MKTMELHLSGALAVLSYLAALAFLIGSLRATGQGRPNKVGPLRLVCLGLGFLAVALHASLFIGNGTLRPSFSFLSALSLVSLYINAILLFTALLRPVEKLAVITFPLAAVIVLLQMSMPDGTKVLNNRSWEMSTHIVTSLIAYSLLNIAALQAIFLAIQDHYLRNHRTDNALMRSLPSLQAMESLMFQLIAAGLLLLTLSLMTGFLFLDDMFAQHLAHKTVLSILAWLVFAILLLGRRRYGWRGQTAIRWTLGGFIALMLAYFGSKMVLELILKRT